jgi:hypothetical protein
MAARFRIEEPMPEFRRGATVTIDRQAGLFSVRPYQRRKVYTLPLSTVAAIVVSKMVKAEIAAKRAERKARRGR